MRTTHISSVKLERKLSYDPSFHGIIENDLQLSVTLLLAEQSLARFGLELKVAFRVATSGEEMGSLEARALTEISGIPVPLDANGEFQEGLATEEFRLLVEGGLAEDVLVPLSLLTRAAKMPTILPIPQVFPRAQRAIRADHQASIEGPGHETDDPAAPAHSNRA